MIKFTVPISPMPQPRPRFTKTGHVYEDNAVKEYKERIREAAKEKMKGDEPFDERLFILLTFYKSMSPKSRQFGDIDNLTKAVLDALNGVVYKDDALVTGLFVMKQSDVRERISIQINSDEPLYLPTK